MSYYDVDKWDLEDSDFDYSELNKKNKDDVRMVKEYCEDHERMYSGTKCKPIWNSDGTLDIYEITLIDKNEKKTKKKKTKKKNS
jgi:hypothetical protein|tara:strand:+ start:246 stop:497 length:252 start_codon:yes stop_codon:yes gene_type:complete